MSTSIPRRNALIFGGGLLGASALSSCAFLSTDPAENPEPQETSTGAKEAPMLIKLVEQGKLPALAERLPKEPFVVTPVTENGQYGGTLRMGQVAPPGGIVSIRAVGRSSLVEWNVDGTGPQPGLAASWDIEDGGRSYVFQLREGVKWSDGEPFTADDLEFFYQSFVLNKTLIPNPNVGWWAPGGKHLVVEKIDDHTVAFRFAAPNGLLLRFLCFPDLALSTILPKHYLSQFHPDYVDESKLIKLAREESYSSWVDLFNARNDLWLNAKRPVLGPWKISKPAGSGNTAEAERNPYYWKVDPDGRQLPYLDKISWFFVELQTLVLRAANGDLDLATASLAYEHMPVLLRNEESKNYRVYWWKDDGSLPAVAVNQNHPDPVLRELFGKIDFRAGLSHAINRDEINESRFLGKGILQHPCGQPEDIYFEEGMGRRFIEFDLDEANARLDAAGLTKRDGDGFRLRPDGKPMRLELTTQSPELVELYELVRRYWAEVGINAFVHAIAGELWWQRLPQAKYDIACTTTETYIWDISPGSVVPTGINAFWAPLFGLWYSSGGADGVEPSGDIRQLQLRYDELKSATDDQVRLELGRSILRLHDQNVWIIGTVMAPANPVVANDNLINVRETGVESYHLGAEEATHVEQVFFKASPAR